jgi:AcrR family transcriptional regulator
MVGMPDRRSDAARNREAVLAAAQRLVDRDGAAAVRIDDVARAARVGPGTIYRGFGSKRDLLLALVDERERALQDALIRGAPPLGPGAPPGERLLAFVDALHAHVLAQRDVLVVADEGSPVSRYATGAHAAWRRHVVLLLADLHPAADAPVLAELVLAPLSAGLHVHLVDERGVDPTVVRAELLRLARLVAAGGSQRP